MVWIITYGSFKLNVNSTIQQNPYKFPLAFHSNYVPILHYF